MTCKQIRRERQKITKGIEKTSWEAAQDASANADADADADAADEPYMSGQKGEPLFAFLNLNQQ